ncbi:ATP-binding protein [Bacillus pseudomycoides]|uniref:ATP-binding protein n=1 Tax=Bacillus pseudomycoides TaxID=64104 RepID=UPI000BFCE337|nr:ATP-binding protein [Bacillus pseudomycoides]PHE46904.1 hypothetical protein COF53_14760 [Bacillus pseudomycoides]
MKLLEFPISKIYKNMVFNKKSGVWSYYKLNDENLSLNSESNFQKYLQQTIAFIEQNQYEYQLVIIPRRYDFDHFIKVTNEKVVKGELADIGKYYFNRGADILKEEISLYEYDCYVGIHLNKFMYEVADNVNDLLIQLFKRVKEDVTRILHRTTNVETDMKFFKKLEESFFNTASYYKKLIRLDESEIEKIIYYQFHRTDICKNIPNTIYNLTEGLVKNNKGYMTVQHKDYTDHIAFLPYNNIPFNLKNNKFLLNLIEGIDFPIEVQARFSFKSQTENIRKFRMLKKRFRNFNDEIRNSNVDEDSVIESADDVLTVTLDEIKNSKKEILYCDLMLVVFDKSLEGLERKIEDIKRMYKGTDFELVRPLVDQLTLFHQSLIGSYTKLNYFQHTMDTSSFAVSCFDIKNEIGNRYGMPLGKVVTGYELVDVTQARAINNNVVFFNPLLTKRALKGAAHTNGNILVTGPPGSGKSLLIKNVFTWCTFLGAKILYIDPKNEYKKFFENALKKYPLNENIEETRYFHELYKKINFVEISNQGEYKGAFDPLIFLQGDEAVETALIILETLGFVKDKRESVIIFESIQEVIKTEKKPNLTKVLEKITEKDQNLGAYIAKYNIGYGRMLFGDENSVTLDFDKQVNVLGLQGLQLPSSEQNIESMTQAQITGISIMVSLSKYVNTFSTKKDEEAMIIFDEAWALKKSKNGEALIDSMLRTGRSLETDIILITQAYDDVNAETIKELIGCKFAFRPKTDQAIKPLLEFFDLETNEDNINLMKNLVSGVCLFQDYKARNQVVAIDIFFEEWLEAFKTTKKEDKAIELEENAI